MSDDRLIKLPAVLDIVQVSRSCWYSMIANGKAPKPVKINRASFWSLQAVQEFIKEIKAGEYQ